MWAGIVVGVVTAVIIYLLGLYNDVVRGALDNYFGSRRTARLKRQISSLENRIDLIESLIGDPARLIAYVMPPVILTLIFLGLMIAVIVALSVGVFPGKEIVSVFVVVVFGLCIFLAKFSIDICEDVAHADRNLTDLKNRLIKLQSIECNKD